MVRELRGIRQEPVTDPPTHTLYIKLYLIDRPEVRWNWEPLNGHLPRNRLLFPATAHTQFPLFKGEDKPLVPDPAGR